MNRIFIDTEFDTAPRFPLTLVSIGLVAEDGRTYYAVNHETRNSPSVNPFVRKHIMPTIIDEWLSDHSIVKTLAEIRHDILAFVGPEKPTFIGWCSGFDFVVLSQLFGQFEDWPKDWPMYILDIQQEADARHEDIPDDTNGRHHALEDAQYIAQMYHRLHAK